MLVGHLHVAEDPSDVGVQEPAYRSPPSGSVAHVGTVRITGDVGELVVLAVGRDPVDYRPFSRRRTERGERGPQQSTRLEAAMR